MDNITNNKDSAIFHKFKEASGPLSISAIVLFVAVILVGLGGGYLLSQKAPVKSVTSNSTINGASSIVKGAVLGSDDTKTFSDSAEGVVQAGGIDGEGQYHLVRPGGDSQNVYMTSSLVDLSQLIGKKVKVNGQTQKAQKAGWLMDVGRVEVLE